MNDLRPFRDRADVAMPATVPRAPCFERSRSPENGSSQAKIRGVWREIVERPESTHSCPSMSTLGREARETGL
jgi:hypothetical protein